MALKTELRITVILPARQISHAITRACAATVVGIATDYRDYLLLRFSAPKHGHRYFVPGRGWYTASAPGEYPAIKYGILYRSMTITRPVTQTSSTRASARAYVGARPFPGMTYGIRRNNPDYAQDLEGLTGTGPTRPYFVRAFHMTKFSRPRYARAHFLSYLYGEAHKRKRTLKTGLPNVPPGTDPGDLIPLGGPTFKTIAQAVKSKQASYSAPKGHSLDLGVVVIDF